MTSSKELTLCFLGQRQYLQGTTLFDALRPWYGAGEAIEFKLARMMRTDRVRVTALAAQDTPSTCSAHLRWRDASEERGICILPLEPSSAPRREPFDEASLVARARFGDDSVVLDGQQGETLVRSMVALNKVLLTSKLKPSMPGQWLFTRLQLRRAPVRFERLALHFHGNLGVAAVTSDIEVDGEPLGQVMFSWSKP